MCHHGLPACPKLPLSLPSLPSLLLLPTSLSREGPIAPHPQAGSQGLIPDGSPRPAVACLPAFPSPPPLWGVPASSLVPISILSHLHHGSQRALNLFASLPYLKPSMVACCLQNQVQIPRHALRVPQARLGSPLTPLSSAQNLLFPKCAGASLTCRLLHTTHPRAFRAQCRDALWGTLWSP